jgi:hypothetical protein
VTNKISAAVIAVLAAFATTAGAQTVPTKFPAAIMCYAAADQSWRLGYLSKINKKGEATYISANGQLGATVDASGKVLAPANRPSGERLSAPG